MIKRVVMGLALVVSLLTGHSSAHAQDRDTQDQDTQDQDKEEAKKFFRVGESAFNSGQYLMAATSFEQAFDKLPLPSIAFSMAQAYRLQYVIDKDPRWLKRAVELYREYLSKQASGGRRTDAASNLAELDPILTRIEMSRKVESIVVKPQTMMVVNSQVKGARASIGGGELQPLPLGRELTAGKYEIIVEAEGYFPFREEREVFAGKFRAVEIDLKPKPSLISIRTESGAAIVVDGRPVGTTPLSRPLEVPAGQHLITVSKRGRIGYSRELVTKRGDKISLEPSLRTSGQRKGALWTMGVSGAIVLGAGGFGVAAFLADNDASDLLNDAKENGGLDGPQQDKYNAARERRNDRRLVAFSLLGVGAAVATTGLLLYFMESPQVEQPTPGTLRVMPILSPSTQGLALGSTF